MTDQAWPTEWLRGVLEVCVLGLLADGPTYGYAIAADLAQAGLGTVKGGTLYPLLNRLESGGLVDIEWRAGEGGPGRKYYRLSEAGLGELERQARTWSEFSDLTTSLAHRALTGPTVGGSS